MGLIMNIYRDSSIPFTQFGGTTMCGELNSQRKAEHWLLTYITEASFAKTTSLPDGNNAPNTWRMPLKAGAISSSNRLLGIGKVSADGHYGLPLIASLVGSGGITQALGSLGIAIYANITASGGVTTALGGLLAQIEAALSGSGAISSSEMLAYLNAIADLTGSGELADADLEGIGELLAILEGDGILDVTLTGTGELVSSIRSYGNLTPEGIRDAVWQAAATSFNDTGTMGQKLNSAAVGGVDYDALATAVWSAAIRRLTTSGVEDIQSGLATDLLAEDIKIIVTELHQIQGLDADNPMTVTPTSRISGDIDLTLTGDGVTSTTVTRNA